MSPNTSERKNGRGGTPEPSLEAVQITALQKGIQQQNTLLVNLSALVHSINRRIPLDTLADGKLLLTGTADILAKADLPAAISYIPEDD